MAISTQDVLELAVLRAGQHPQWTDRAVDNTAGAAAPFEARPTPLDAGTPLNDALVALLKVQVRFNPDSMTAEVTIDGLDVAETYTITINATPHVDAGAETTEEAILDEIGGLINVGAQSAVVQADPVVGVGPAAKLVIRGIVEADFTISTSVSGGAASMTLVADATFADVEVYFRSKNRSLVEWNLAPNGAFSVDNRNLGDHRFFPAGEEAIFVRVEDTDGRALIAIGPCGLT